MRKLLIPSLLVLLASFIGVARADSTDVKCGQVIKASIELHNDLHNCATNGLVVGAKSIDIDLNGHLIDGDGSGGTGILNDKGYSHVRVRDGQITNFDRAVFVNGKGFIGDTLEDLELSANDAGIAVAGDSNTIEDNSVRDGIQAIAVKGNRNVISNNEVSYASSGKQGYAIAFNGFRNSVIDNDIVRGQNGIAGKGDQNLIEKNDLAAGSGHGIVLAGGSNALIKNEVELYRGFGYWLLGDGTKNLLLKNDATRNAVDGFRVASPDTTLEKNDSEHNAKNGVNVSADDATLEKNDAAHNGDVGILVTGDDADGADNEAHGNGADDCRPDDLCD